MLFMEINDDTMEPHTETGPRADDFVECKADDFVACTHPEGGRSHETY